MPEVDLEKLRSVGHVGKTRAAARVRTVESDDGRRRAFEIDYPDGRKAAVVRPDTVRHSVSIKEL